MAAEHTEHVPRGARSLPCDRFQAGLVVDMLDSGTRAACVLNGGWLPRCITLGGLGPEFGLDATMERLADTFVERTAQTLTLLCGALTGERGMTC
jgi:hypothetical protein